MNIEDLKKQLETKSVSDLVNEVILCDSSHYFKKKNTLLLQLKRDISHHFDIHLKKFEIVGSAKIGVSLSEKRFGQPFSKTSDIDIAIVSSSLFDQAWHELLLMEFKYYKLREEERGKLKDTYETIYRGYISPDRLPMSLEFTKKWWYIFEKLSNNTEYEYRKIRGRLFKNWWFVEKYYSIQIIKLKK